MSSIRSRSRSPHHQDRERRPKSMILISNLPRSWNFEKIKIFVKENTPAGNLMTYVDIKSTGDCTVKFATTSAAKKACDDLDGLIVDGQKIHIQLIDAKQLSIPYQKPRKEWNRNTTKPQQSITQSGDNNDTYGLSLGYLGSLGISPPLSNKIFVYNLSDEVDEAKIRDVFGMAGHIVTIILKKRSQDLPSERMKVTAKIEYDHPVEAVQAIAMFNNQELLDRPMLMRLDYLIKGPLRKQVPGLKAIGPALGENGEPMRNVRQFIELQVLRQEVWDKFNAITTNSQQQSNNVGQVTNLNNALTGMGGQMINNTMAGQMMANMTPNLNANAFNPGFVLNPMVSNQTMPWAGMIQNPLNMIQTQATTPQMNAWKPLDNLVNQVIPVSNQGMIQGNMNSFQPQQGQQGQDDRPNPNWSQQQQTFDSRGGGEGYDKGDFKESSELRRDDDDRRRESVSETLVFKYLPPSVNLATLQQKMREIGEVKLVEMTGHGRAIVRFMSTREAEQCIRMYDRSRVDGQVIEVKYF